MRHPRPSSRQQPAHRSRAQARKADRPANARHRNTPPPARQAKSTAPRPAPRRLLEHGWVTLDGLPFGSRLSDHAVEGCDVPLTFAGFDSKVGWASVEFADASPNADAGLAVLHGDRSPFIGDDRVRLDARAVDVDASPMYRLSFTGEPYAEGAYLVRVTVEARGWRAADSKTREFWVTDCAAASEGAVAPAAGPPPASRHDPRTLILLTMIGGLLLIVGSAMNLVNRRRPAAVS